MDVDGVVMNNKNVNVASTNKSACCRRATFNTYWRERIREKYRSTTRPSSSSSNAVMSLLLLLLSSFVTRISLCRAIPVDTNKSLNKRRKLRRHPTVKVVIVAGDGNVEGFASKTHLVELIRHKQKREQEQHKPKTSSQTTSPDDSVSQFKQQQYEQQEEYDQFSHLIKSETTINNNNKNNNNKNNNTNPQLHNPIEWTVQEGVYVTSVPVHVTTLSNGTKQTDVFLHGPISLQQTKFGHTDGTFGPEIQMGYVLGNNYNSASSSGKKKSRQGTPVIIVKAGWHDRTLHKDWLNGFQFYRMLNAIEQTAKQFHIVLNNTKYKHATIDYIGMVWWHGSPDILMNARQQQGSTPGNTKSWKQKQQQHQQLVPTATTPGATGGTTSTTTTATAAMVASYAQDMYDFFEAVRKKIRQPELPIAIVELGHSGETRVPPIEMEFRQMQYDVCYSILAGTCTFVTTSHIAERMVYNNYNSVFDINHQPTNRSDYYFGHADVMLEISQDIATSLIELNEQILYNERDRAYNRLWLGGKSSDSANDNKAMGMYNSNQEVDVVESEVQESEYTRSIGLTIVCIVLFFLIKWRWDVYHDQFGEESESTIYEDPNNPAGQRRNGSASRNKLAAATTSYTIAAAKSLASLFRPKLETINEYDDDDEEEDDDDNRVIVPEEDVIKQRANQFGVKPQY